MSAPPTQPAKPSRIIRRLVAIATFAILSLAYVSVPISAGSRNIDKEAIALQTCLAGGPSLTPVVVPPPAVLHAKTCVDNFQPCSDTSYAICIQDWICETIHEKRPDLVDKRPPPSSPGAPNYYSCITQPGTCIGNNGLPGVGTGMGIGNLTTNGGGNCYPADFTCPGIGTIGTIPTGLTVTGVGVNPVSCNNVSLCPVATGIPPPVVVTAGVPGVNAAPTCYAISNGPCPPYTSPGPDVVGYSAPLSGYSGIYGAPISSGTLCVGVGVSGSNQPYCHFPPLPPPPSQYDSLAVLVANDGSWYGVVGCTTPCPAATPAGIVLHFGVNNNAPISIFLCAGTTPCGTIPMLLLADPLSGTPFPVGVCGGLCGIGFALTAPVAASVCGTVTPCPAGSFGATATIVATPGGTAGGSQCLAPAACPIPGTTSAGVTGTGAVAGTVCVYICNGVVTLASVGAGINGVTCIPVPWCSPPGPPGAGWITPSILAPGGQAPGILGVCVPMPGIGYTPCTGILFGPGGTGFGYPGTTFVCI